MPEDFEQKFNDLQQQFDELKQLFDNHMHIEGDGSKEFDGKTPMNVQEVLISAAGKILRSGYTRLPFSITDAHDSELAGARTISQGLVIQNKDQDGEQVQGVILSGKFQTAEDLEIVNRADWDKTNYAFIRLIHETKGQANGSLPPLSFFVGDRTPYVTGNGSLSNGGTTLVDSSALFETDRFVNCILNIRNSDGNTVESFIVTGNTENTITVNGTWTINSGTYGYVLVTPMLLGAADDPWHRLYVGNDIRIGYGPSAGTGVIYIKHGYGSPEGVVTANRGSLYLRRDGGATTTLYVKTSGDGTATGWTAK